MKLREFTRRRALIANRTNHQGRRFRKEMAHLMREARAVPVMASGKVVGFRLPDGTIVCMKERFRDEASALQAMRYMHETNYNNHRVPVRVYACGFCRGYHLTSQAKSSA